MDTAPYTSASVPFQSCPMLSYPPGCLRDTLYWLECYLCIKAQAPYLLHTSSPATPMLQLSLQILWHGGHYSPSQSSFIHEPQLLGAGLRPSTLAKGNFRTQCCLRGGGRGMRQLATRIPQVAGRLLTSGSPTLGHAASTLLCPKCVASCTWQTG